MVRFRPAPYTSCASAVDRTTFHSGIAAGDHALAPIDPLISTIRFASCAEPRLFPERVGDVLQRPDGDERDLAGVLAQRVDDEVGGGGGDGLLGGEVFGPAELIVELARRLRRPSHRHRHVVAADDVEELAGHFGARGRVAVGDGHAHELDVRRGHQQPERPRVVDVRGDVGVEQNLEVTRRLGRRGASQENSEEQGEGKEAASHRAAHLTGYFRFALCSLHALKVTRPFGRVTLPGSTA